MAISAGNVTKQYVSAIPFLDKRQILPNIIDVANDSNFLDTMALFGRTKALPSDVFSYHNFVNSDLYATGVVGASPTGSGSATVTVTFAAGAGAGAFRPGDLIKFNNGKVGYVQTVTNSAGTDTVTATSVDGSNLTVAAGNILTYSGNAVGQNSSAVANKRYDLTKYFNLIQAFREVDVITDVAGLSKVEIEYNGKNLYSLYQHAMKVQQLKASVDVAMIGGVISTTQFSDANPALVDAAGNAVQTTNGLDNYCALYAGNLVVATPGTVVLADINALAAQLNSTKSPLDFMGLTPDIAKRAYDTYLKNLGSSGITSVKMEIDGRSIDMNVDKFTFGTRTYEFVPLMLQDHPKLLNGNIKSSIYWIPKGKVNCKGSEAQPRIRVRYVPNPINGSGNDMISETHTGMFAPTPTNDQANWTTHWMTYQGLECLGVQQFCKQQVAAITANT